MPWRQVHRWLGLCAGTIAVLVGITGVILSFFPVRDAWQAYPVERGLAVAILAQRVAEHVPGIEEVRQLPSGAIVAYSFDGDQARAFRIDPADGQIWGDYRASAVERWVRNLHRSLFLDDAGRLVAAGVALAMFLLAISGVLLIVRRLGGWLHLLGRIRGSLAQRIHGVAGRVLVLLIALSSCTALYMSATTFGVVPAGAAADPDVASEPGTEPDLSPGELPLLQTLSAEGFRKLNFPSAHDPEDVWTITTDWGDVWIDRRSGRVLASEPARNLQRVFDWVYILHTGQGLWAWALLLSLMGLSIPLFWGSGLLIWLDGRRNIPKLSNNSLPQRADMLIFVASESGSTWGFAKALHDALARNGHVVHVGALERFQLAEPARQVFILAATYGDGQAPAHAAGALERIAAIPSGTVPVTVLGFGDRQFPAFCGYAEALDRTLRQNGWPQTLPLERIHQQSSQHFDRWGLALSEALGEQLELHYVPRIPRTIALELVGRQDYLAGEDRSTAILRFRWPGSHWLDRLMGRGMPYFEAGDLVGIVPPGSPVPRYYSLASSFRSGFLEICVRRMPAGVCSGFLHELELGGQIRAFIKPNPGFTLERTRRPVVLIGAGTGIAPLAGFIRDNARKAPMTLYFGARDPAEDFYFREAIQRWLADRRLSELRTAFSRTPGGGGYVQDVLRRDAEYLRNLVSNGASMRVCGSRPMAQGVAEALDGILKAIGSSVRQLKERGRYAEDVF